MTTTWNDVRAVLAGSAGPFSPRLPEPEDALVAVKKLFGNLSSIPVDDEALEVAQILATAVHGVYSEALSADDFNSVGEGLLLTLGQTISKGWRVKIKTGAVGMIWTGAEDVFRLDSQRLEDLKNGEIIRDSVTGVFRYKNRLSPGAKVLASFREDLNRAGYSDFFSDSYRLELVPIPDGAPSVHLIMDDPKDHVVFRLMCPASEPIFYPSFDNVTRWVMDNLPTHAAVFYMRTIVVLSRVRVRMLYSKVWHEFAERYQAIILDS